MESNSDCKTSIIGAGEAGRTISAEPDKQAAHKTNRLFWDTKGTELLGATALPFYGAFITEEACSLLGELSGKTVLEIGCGCGQSLKYAGKRGAAGLWGLDISEQQIEKAKQCLAECGLSAKFICAPMEDECGIPKNYFDVVYSVYAIGWTTDLEATFGRIASYLKKGGEFIFSWSHPIHKCIAAENGSFVFKKSYFDESWYSVSLGENTLTMSDRMLSTYINALAGAGFFIEQMVERSDAEIISSCDDNNDFAKKARVLPVTFVIKARKQ